MKIENLKEWHKIGDKLCFYFKICSCQRKLKTIITFLYNLKVKINEDKELTGEEYLIIAILDSLNLGTTHGINIEYPILFKDHEFWLWIDECINNPDLLDN